MTDRSMPRFFKQALSFALVAGFAGALGISRLAAQQTPEPEPLTKEARNEGGAVLSGAVSAGQTITYVLTYSPPPSGATGAIKISDTLGPGQTYVADSIIAPPGWDWAAAPDFASGGTEEFTHPGFAGAGNSFAMTIPGTGNSTPSTGGDGTFPIVVGSRVYSIYHHRVFKSSNAAGNSYGGLINCWDAATLQTCPGSWPMSLDSASTAGTKDGERTTIDVPLHYVLGTRIYYPTAQWDVNGTSADTSDDKTIPGIGCWETLNETPCDFIPLPHSFAGRIEGWNKPFHAPYKLAHYSAGIVAIPSATNPGEARAFMLAGDKVYCVDLPSGSMCAGWTLTTLPSATVTSGADSYGANDFIILENSPSPQKLFVLAGGLPAVVSCLDVSTGQKCSGWLDSTDGVATGLNSPYSLSLQLSSDGTGTVGVCIHPRPGQGAHRCFGASTGSDADAPELPTIGAFSDVSAMSMFHIPGTARILYPSSVFQAPVCRDFSTGTAVICSAAEFNPMWWSGFAGQTSATSIDQSKSPATRDYGYEVDPIAPDKCLLGLGDGGILWRFERDGTYPAEDCLPEEYRETFRLEQFFCAEMPTEAMWETIEIVNRPADLTGGTITVLDAQNNVLANFEVGSGNSYPLDIQALGASSEVTLVFDPTYTKAPDKPFELHLTFSANRAQQICYKAVVEQCEDITNSATMTEGRGSFSASTTLGPVVGGECGGGGVNCLGVEPTLKANGSGGAILSLGGLGDVPNLSDLQMSVAVDGQSVGAVPQPMTGGIASWALDGVGAGSVVTLSLQGTREGAGSVPGTELCCNSTFTLVVENEGEGPSENPDPGEGGIDFGIEKSGWQDSASPSSVTFELQVYNWASMPVSAMGVTVLDTVPPGLTFTAANGPGWDCGPASQFPLQAGDQLVCHYTGTEVLNTGDGIPFLVVDATVASGLPAFDNCASVSPSEQSGLVDSRPYNNEGCFNSDTGIYLPSCDPGTTSSGADCYCLFEDMIKVSDTMCGCPAGQIFVEGQGCEEGNGAEREEPESGGVDFGLEKGVNNPGSNPIEFGIFVTNYGTSPAPATGTTVIDTVPPGLTFTGLNAPGWDCGPADQFPLEAGEQLICRYTGTETLNPGDSFPGILFTAVADAGTTTFENCATVSPSEESGLVDSRLFNNEGCFSPEEGAHLPACDPATTTSPAGDCICRFEDMIEVSDTMCGCPAGQTFVAGQGCEEGDGPEMSVPEEEPPACDPDTTKLEGGQCVCLFEGMTPISATTCSCKEGETYYPGAGCRPTAPATPPAPPPTPPALSCDRDTTKAENGACVCLYPNMRRSDEETCGCKRGEELIPGVGCRPREVTPPPEERRMCDQITTIIDGDGCACRHKGAEPTSPTTCACPAGTTLDRSIMACVPQCREPLVLDKTLLICVPKCEEPMILNRETLKCECPEGMELEDGKCVEESSIFDDIDINIGIGIGGSGGRRDPGPGPTPSPSPGPVPGRP
ncbi:MAG TPA: hypothetical protein PL096_03005 [Micropepsaceae bacterium]|nr:hypothetical protein [Micropepsaceae bacterium]